MRLRNTLIALGVAVALEILSHQGLIGAVPHELTVGGVAALALANLWTNPNGTSARAPYEPEKK